MTTDAPPPPDDTSGGEGASEADEARGRGRPSKLTDDVKKTLFSALRRGHPPESACDLADICVATYHGWRKQGKADKAAGKKTEHSDFLDTSNRALALFYDKHLRRIDKASRSAVGEVEYRASLQILGRRAPEHFAERKGVELSGPGGGAIQIQSLEDAIALHGAAAASPDDKAGA